MISVRGGEFIMNVNMKDCFTGHTVMHSLVGLGLGFSLASLVPSLANLWLGVVLIVIGVAADKMRK